MAKNKSFDAKSIRTAAKQAGQLMRLLNKAADALEEQDLYNDLNTLDKPAVNVPKTLMKAVGVVGVLEARASAWH